jgi:hypothetical protein
MSQYEILVTNGVRNIDQNSSENDYEKNGNHTRKLDIRFPVRTAALVEESRQCSTIHMALLSYNPILYYYHMI